MVLQKPLRSLGLPFLRGWQRRTGLGRKRKEQAGRKGFCLPKGCWAREVAVRSPLFLMEESARPRSNPFWVPSRGERVRSLALEAPTRPKPCGSKKGRSRPKKGLDPFRGVFGSKSPFVPYLVFLIVGFVLPLGNLISFRTVCLRARGSVIGPISGGYFGFRPPLKSRSPPALKSRSPRGPVSHSIYF